MVNIENEILVSLYRKQNLGQASDSDREEISARQKEKPHLNLVDLRNVTSQS